MTMKSIGLAAAVAALAVSGISHAATAKAPEPARAVDLKRFYSGVWIEIGRRPMKLTDGCVAGATEYKIVGATRVNVRDTCHAGTPAGKLKAIGGPGEIKDPGANAKLHVTYRVFGFIPVASWEYWVLDHDDAYTWFISADPTFKNLWIYTRDPHVDPALLKSLIAKAQALGYDTAKLEFPAQP